MPHLQYEADIAFYQRFEREEKIGQKLDHPNIVRVLSPEKKSRMYLVMELAEGTVAPRHPGQQAHGRRRGR